MKEKAISWYVPDEKLKEVLKTHYFEPKRGYRVIETKEGDRFFVKSFVERGLVGYFRNLIFPRGKKEFEIAKKLKNLSIEIPCCLGYGIAHWGSLSVWRYMPFETYMEKFSLSEDRLTLIKMLAEFLKKLKENCIRHDDLHLHNLLVGKDQLILVDLHKVKIKKRFGKNDEIWNLCHALNMVYREFDSKEKEAFFDFYGKADLRPKVEEKLKVLRESWIKRKMRRAFSTTSVVSVFQDKRFVRGYEGIVQGPFVSQLKKDRKVEIFRYANCIKKIYKGRRRLKKAWVNSVILEYMKLRITPRVYSVSLPLFSSGFLLMEDLSRYGGMEMDRYLDGPYLDMDQKKRRDFIITFSSFFRNLLKHGVFHKDLKGCNIYVTEKGEFFLMDVEDIMFREVGKKELVAMLTKLNNTIPRRIPTKDRLRFLFAIDIFSRAEKKKIFYEVVERSKKEEIVYEGKEGLMVERWEK